MSNETYCEFCGAQLPEGASMTGGYGFCVNTDCRDRFFGGDEL